MVQTCRLRYVISESSGPKEIMDELRFEPITCNLARTVGFPSRLVSWNFVGRGPIYGLNVSVEMRDF